MMSSSRYGKVFLIGAGPGDEGLITVRGLQCLRQADVVLYDGLANESLLRHAKRDAIQLCVGKHGHGGMWTQKEIDERTIEYAKRGKCVARLKGGDTTIFARTAEETEKLASEGIPFEVIPGITAALAVSAYTGIPLTHRDWASAVAMITAQLQPVDGDDAPEDELDWNSLAHFRGTLVFYMGVTTAKFWSQKLISHGKSPSTPVALARRVSWHDQTVVTCDLGTVAHTIEKLQGFRPPVIAIVGDVVGMAISQDWFTSRPLHGKRLIIASPESTGEKLSQLLEERGASVVREPSVKIGDPIDWAPVDAAMSRLNQFDWIVFASSHGVDSFFRRLHALGKDARALAHNKVASVGTSTSASLARFGITADRTPQVSGMDALLPLLVTECSNQRFLFVRTPTGKTLGMDVLQGQGAIVESIDVYCQHPVDVWPSRLLDEFAARKIDGVVVTSQQIAANAYRLIGIEATNTNWFCLSKSIGDSLVELGCQQVMAASEATLENLVGLIESFFTKS